MIMVAALVAAGLLVLLRFRYARRSNARLYMIVAVGWAAMAGFGVYTFALTGNNNLGVLAVGLSMVMLLPLLAFPAQTVETSR